MAYIDEKAITINALIDSVESIERELGLLPSGVYASVRTRLDILEARINNPFAPAPNVQNPFFIGDTGVTISTGFGFPTEDRIPGSLYLREDGYNIEGLYAFRPDGYWHQIDTDPWTANGDLAGTIYKQTVIGLQNHPINPDTTLNQTDSRGDGYVLTWNQAANDGYGWWEPQIGFFAFGDLYGTKVNQMVVNLQGTPLNIGVPTDGYVLTWNGFLKTWHPERAAVVFDPLDTPDTTNIRSNRYTTQSPVGPTGFGMINLSSDTTQSTVGVIGDYSAILGGDQNEVWGRYSSIVGGKANLVSGSQSFMGGGNQNQASGFNSIVVGGELNSVSVDNSIIVGGENNQIIGLGTDNAIIAGTSNSILGTSAGSIILDGYSHAVLSSQGAIIGNGDTNFVQGGLNNTILNGSGNSIVPGTNPPLNNFVSLGNDNTISGGAFNTVAGGGNTINDSRHACVYGHNNTVFSDFAYVWGEANAVENGNCTFISITGDNNTATASPYTTVWGSQNFTADGYLVVYGFGNSLNTGTTYSAVFGTGNIMNSPATYGDIHGSNNSIDSSYAAVWGNANIIDVTSSYSTIYGNNNVVHASSPYAYIVGSGDTLTGTYNSAWGSSVTINGTYNTGWGNVVSMTGNYSSAYGASLTMNANYSTIWGANSTIANGSNYSNIYGYYNTISQVNSVGTDGSFVHGQFGQAINPGQYTHAQQTFNGFQSGTAQFSRIILTGTGTSGAPITMTTDGTHTLNMENGKSYDMFVKIDVTQTTGTTGVTARYQFDLLAHKESNAVTIDRVNTYLVSDNGTGWVGNLWSGIFSAASTTIAVGSNGASLPQSTINVASTSGFPTSGTIYVLSSTGYQAVNYTNTTLTSFTGCSIIYSPQFGGSLGTLSTGNAVYTLTGGSGSTLSMVLPASGSQTRRAVASIEWREITRL